MRIRNWDKFQHYTHRCPPWIKLYRDLLNDHEWMSLSGDASKLLACCWLIASEQAGELPELGVIAWRVRMDPTLVAKLFSELDHWIEHDASDTLAPCKHNASEVLLQSRVETETETETETEARASTRARNRKNGCSLPPDWMPTEADQKWASEKGFPLEWISEQTESMEMWARANSNRGVARKADWSLTWRNWLKREWEKHRPSAAGQVSPLMAACDRTIAMAERFADPFGEITTDVDPLQIPDLSIPDFLRRN
jgi:hypothetical protein